ncbi:FtsX-like permease family protein [Microbacterium sp. ZW T5_45]|uniref:ABC transporter permease n=1 Tax=Microbacterium sp. ZW T5_45 TaxID=3378080 RepID=UPI003851AAAC
MTSTLDRRPISEGTRRPDPRPSSGARRARWTVAARLARRQVARTRLSSLLVSVLVMLPIAAMSAYAVIGLSSVATPEERARVELGRTQAWIAVAGIPDAGFWQSPTEPTWTGYPGDGQIPDREPIDDPITLLPAGAETLRTTESSVRVTTPDGVTAMRTTSGETWDPRFAGRYDLVDGRVPATDEEILVTPATLDRLQIAIGDEVALDDPARSFTVTGTLRAAELDATVPALFVSEAAGLPGGNARWYLPGTSLSWSEVEELNASGVVAFSRDVVLDPPTLDPDTPQGSFTPLSNSLWPIVMMLLAGGLFSAYVVVMLAGAAFAVAARRQQRSLAVAASVGATPSDLRRVIVLQGTFLGLIGGVSGIAVGIGAAALTMSLTTNGSATQFWGFHVPWAVLAGVLVFAVLVGTLSAAVPAHTVARSDTIAALRGARRPQRPRASRPIWGSVLMLVGVGITIGSALVIIASRAVVLDPDSPMRVIPPLGIVIGPIVVQIGILLSGRWLLWLTSRLLSPLGLSSRLAARDAAANSSRTVPAFAAIAATVFVAVFAIGQGAMQTGATARDWGYQAPEGSMAVSLYPAGDEALDAQASTDAAEAGLELATASGAASAAVLSQQADVWSYPNASVIPPERTQVIAVLPDRHLLDPAGPESYTWGGRNPTNPISVIPADELETAIGAELTPAQLEQYRNGAPLVTDPRYVENGTIEIGAWSARDAYEGRMPDNIWAPSPDMVDRADPQWSERVDAVQVDLPLQPVLVAVSPETAASYGLNVRPYLVIAAFDTTVPVSERDRTQALSETLSTSTWIVAPYFEDGPPSNVGWLVPLLAAVSILVLGASAVALGLARFERRPDDATLAAVGGTTGLRRRIGFWQGLLIAGFGTLAGTAAGVLPPIGFAIQSAGMWDLTDVPWMLLLTLTVALPLAIAVVSWLVAPRAPELTRRTAIA